MKKIYFILQVWALSLFAGEEKLPKITIFSSLKNPDTECLDQYKSLSIETEAVKCEVPPTDEWLEQLSAYFKIDFNPRGESANIDLSMIKTNRKINVTKSIGQYGERITDIDVISQRKRIVSSNKAVCPLIKNDEDSSSGQCYFTLPDVFGHFLHFRLPRFLPKSCDCNGFLLNPTNRSGYVSLIQEMRYSPADRASLLPALSSIFAAKYLIVSGVKPQESAQSEQ